MKYPNTQRGSIFDINQFGMPNDLTNLRLPALANCLTIALLPVPGEPEMKGTNPAVRVMATSHVSLRGVTRIADVRLLLMISFYEWNPNFLDCLLNTAPITYAGESPCSKAFLR